MFEETTDYTELLLNLSVVDQDGVVSRLIHDIPEEDFDVNRGGQVEIIGWLYQYYNTEPKNEAFAKNGKTTKEEIPAVTQLFTPDWIVRYMVENSLGRLWLDGHPNNELKANWKYYLDEAEQEPEVQAQLKKIHEEHAKLAPEDIKLIDPCMGSGHILVYAFDVLMQIYESVGYNKRDAAVKILENNIYGLDIDDRAYQLAYFAVMMKARQYNRRILSKDVPCHVYSIQESNNINRNHLDYLGSGLEDLQRYEAKHQLTELLDTFIDAKEYGSILNVENYDWSLLRSFIEADNNAGQMPLEAVGLKETQDSLRCLIDFGEVMARKYEIVVTNPPYMSSGSMSSKLSKYVKKEYEIYKSDLYAVFIRKCQQFSDSNGLISMITQHTWMFLSRYEKMRCSFQNSFINMLHLGARAFDEISGEVVQTVAFTFLPLIVKDYRAKYCRLIDYSGEVEKEREFHNLANQCLARQDTFMSLPGSPCAYWASHNEIQDFQKGTPLKDVATPRVGLITGNNDMFIRCWWEIQSNSINSSATEINDTYKASNWYPYNKGGSIRKWFGNRELVVSYINAGENIEKNGKETGCFYFLGANDVFFRQGITWNGLASRSNSFRFSPVGSMFDSNKGPMLFSDNEKTIYSLLALFNSKVTQLFLEILNPSISIQAGDFEKMPILDIDSDNTINICKECVDISKKEWDSFEASLDFKLNPLLGGNTMGRLIAEKYKEWEDECNKRFNQLKANEEELNRIFIDIYGLQDELTPEVDDKDVTVRKAELKRDIKSLLSYAVGCMFGRYSLDVEGLAYAGGDWDDSKYQSFVPDKDNVIPITDEEYLEDDIVARLVMWLKVVYGEDTLEQNLDFIANALGNKGDSSRAVIRNYFLNDFFNDHCQTYSVTGSGKRPIYWLFDSGKQNGFKALIYLHRYNADTIGNLRVDYLHRIQRIYESEIARMQDTIDNSTNNRDVAQATKRKEKLTKQLKECREYDEKIGHLALSRIELDLDDGVKVNYKKLQTANDGLFYEVLANSKNIMVKEK